MDTAIQQYSVMLFLLIFLC